MRPNHTLSPEAQGSAVTLLRTVSCWERGKVGCLSLRVWLREGGGKKDRAEKDASLAIQTPENFYAESGTPLPCCLRLGDAWSREEKTLTQGSTESQGPEQSLLALRALGPHSTSACMGPGPLRNINSGLPAVPLPKHPSSQARPKVRPPMTFLHPLTRNPPLNIPSLGLYVSLSPLETSSSKSHKTQISLPGSPVLEREMFKENCLVFALQ